MRDHFSLLLPASPFIGFLIAIALPPRQVLRGLTALNAIVLLTILVLCARQLKVDSDHEATSRIVSEDDLQVAGNRESAHEMVQLRADRQLAERRSREWLIVDGLNLWPLFVFVVISGLVGWQTHFTMPSARWFVPVVFLFEATTILALTANDLRVFLFADCAAVLALTGILSYWGGLERRAMAARLLNNQYCGISFVMLGFAMLTTAVPWMKIEDAPQPPLIIWNLSKIIYEIQWWTTNNELAYQYSIETFSSMLLIMSLGFAIQFGLFPFQSTQITLLCSQPRSICLLYAAGLLPLASIGWLRFVLPLAPDRLVGLDWLLLIPAVGGGLWAVIHAVLPGGQRQKSVFLFSGLFSVSLLGSYTLTRIGMSGAWLMQQQVTASLCLAFFLTDSGDDLGFGTTDNRVAGGCSTRLLLGLFAVGAFGLTASGLVILSALVRESLLLPAVVLVMGILAIVAVYSLINGHVGPKDSLPISRRMLIVAALVVVAHLFPGLLLHQCEQEFGHILRRFEPTAPATSAESESALRQTSP